MKYSLLILLVTGAFAITATLLAWAQGGKQEDVACAIGGIIGFAIAFSVVNTVAKRNTIGKSRDENRPEAGFAYGVFAVAYFAFIGWLTGYLHGHGDLAGTVCGGLGGFILAVIAPAILRSPFMALGRKYQFVLSVIALGALVRIVWVMYVPEFIY